MHRNKCLFNDLRRIIMRALLLMITLGAAVTGCKSEAQREYEKLADLRREAIVRFCQDPYNEECFKTHLEDEISTCMEENSIQLEKARLGRAEVLYFCRTSIWKQDQWPGGDVQ
jgi:hypothetical protein